MNRCPRCQSEYFVKMALSTKINATNVPVVSINGHARHYEDTRLNIKGYLCFYIVMVFQCMLSQNFLVNTLKVLTYCISTSFLYDASISLLIFSKSMCGSVRACSSKNFSNSADRFGSNFLRFLNASA